VQALAALPWLRVITRRPFGELLKIVGGIAAAAFLGLFYFLYQYTDPGLLGQAGRVYAALLQLQLTADLFIGVFRLLLLVWPKGGAVALAAFQEGVRQPMFWMLAFAGSAIMVISVFIPYFTFGEDLKMVKELCYAFTMLGPAVFAVVAACMSVTEEIEGRTAVTLMSKPIARRHFLLGKFAGISSAALFMTAWMGWVLIWVFLYKSWYDGSVPGNFVDTSGEGWAMSRIEELGLSGSTVGELARGIALWTYDAGASLPGLAIGFCQVSVLTAVAVALATRVPMVVNLTMCLLVYLMGHLTPIMTEVSGRIDPMTGRPRYALVAFVAQVFETIFPGLDLFDVGSSIIRDLPLDPVDYSIYTLNVALYGLTYTAIALLAGLFLFEDRDLA
jgi:ABC-type transport system involved in multi-copper enzyme maturation permease subunit